MVSCLPQSSQVDAIEATLVPGGRGGEGVRVVRRLMVMMGKVMVEGVVLVEKVMEGAENGDTKNRCDKSVEKWILVKKDGNYDAKSQKW